MMDPAALLDEFRAEALDHVRALEEELLKLERALGSPQPVRRMFLAVHTIKGGAAMLSLAELRDLSHAMEDVLATVRDGRHTCDRATTDLLLRGADLLRALILGGDPEPFHAAIAALEVELRTLIGGDASATAQQAPPTGAQPPPLTDGPQAPPAAGSHAPTPRRALVVDDSPLVRAIEAALLQGAGYDVDATDDGQDALRMIQASPYTLLVTSIETRGMSGLALASAARASTAGPDIAIIIVTSGDAAAQTDEARQVGVTAWLPKGHDGQRRLVDIASTLGSTT